MAVNVCRIPQRGDQVILQSDHRVIISERVAAKLEHELIIHTPVQDRTRQCSYQAAANQKFPIAKFLGP